MQVRCDASVLKLDWFTTSYKFLGKLISCQKNLLIWVLTTVELSVGSVRCPEVHVPSWYSQRSQKCCSRIYVPTKATGELKFRIKIPNVNLKNSRLKYQLNQFSINGMAPSWSHCLSIVQFWGLHYPQCNLTTTGDRFGCVMLIVADVASSSYFQLKIRSDCRVYVSSFLSVSITQDLFLFFKLEGN